MDPQPHPYLLPSSLTYRQLISYSWEGEGSLLMTRYVLSSSNTFSSIQNLDLISQLPLSLLWLGFFSGVNYHSKKLNDEVLPGVFKYQTLDTTYGTQWIATAYPRHNSSCIM